MDHVLWHSFETVASRSAIRYPRNLQSSLRDYINHLNVEESLRRKMILKMPSLTDLKYACKTLHRNKPGNFGCTVEKIKFICQQHPPPPFRKVEDGRFKCHRHEQDSPIVLSTESITVEGTLVTQMVLVVSTLTMLATAAEALFLCVDGTYNLSLQRTVGIVVGALDPSKRIHPVALALVIKEDAAAYAEVIRQINNACYGYFQKRMEPLVLQADGAWQITNGVLEALSEAGASPPARASCWYHVKAKIRSNLLGTHRIGKQVWGHISHELDLLKECFSRVDFVAGVGLFFSKWYAKCNVEEFEEPANEDVGDQDAQVREKVSDQCDSELGLEDIQNLISENAITEDSLQELLNQTVISESIFNAAKIFLVTRQENPDGTGVENPVGTRQENPARAGEENPVMPSGLRSALNYLRSEYLNPQHFRSNFYAGCLPEQGRWCSKTNCALEGFNNSLKTVATNNRIPSLEGLLRALVGSPMMNISMESRNTPADKPPTPSRDMLRDAAMLYDHFSEVAILVSDRLDLSDCSIFNAKNVYIFKNEDVEFFDLRRIETFLRSKQVSLTQFRCDKKDLCAVCWKTEAKFSVPPPEGLQCTCCVYNRKNICSHVICVALVCGTFSHDAIARFPMDRRNHSFNAFNVGNKSKYGLIGPVVPRNVNGRTARKKNLNIKRLREG